jgi:hypothetical protein
VLLVQLPIPPAGPEAVRGNVPLAAGYLLLHAARTGRARDVDIDILSPGLANVLGDRALVDAIVARAPDLIGFTCYLWNVDRTLWVAERVRERLPGVRILLGGPEITTDNGWVLEAETVDWFAVGEGEQTFAELLGTGLDPSGIPGLVFRARGRLVRNPPRVPLADIGAISSPYLDGILDAADSESLLLETSRGCVFKCKFCYYPKAYDRQYFLSPELVLRNLAHARERGAREVFLLDPTLNQRPDFASFVELLAEGNPERTLEYHAELRGEGITPKIAARMRDANFAEVEIGLQSIDPLAQELMDRRNNLRAFETGVRALRDAGIRTKVDLIVGLPGDTAESVRRGMRWLAERDLVDEVQVFQLGILPGTAFRREAAQLGLEFQDRPPYAVLRTPTLGLDAMRELVAEAEAVFDTGFDPLPEPWLELSGTAEVAGVPSRWRIELDREPGGAPPERTGQVFTLWFRAHDPFRHSAAIVQAIRTHLAANPFSTLQVVLEAGTEFALDVLDAVEAAFAVPERVYLDRYHEWTPGRPRASRRITVLLPGGPGFGLDPSWCRALGSRVDVEWRDLSRTAR